MADKVADMRKEFRDEIRSLKDEIRRQVSQALENSGPSSIRVDLQKDDVAQAEPSFVVVKDLVRQIREDVKSSLATRGEIAVDELVDNMPPELERVVSRCLRKHRERRFRHMDERSRSRS